MIISRLFLRNSNKNPFFSKRNYVKRQHPFIRTWETLTQPLRLGSKNKSIVYPEHADIVIIGGGFLGSSVAYWLKTRAGDGLSVVVLEKDPTYASNQNMLAETMLTQHFTLPENIYLSQFSAEFLRNAKETLNPDIDVEFRPLGHLLLANEKYAGKLEQNVDIQKDYGIKNLLLTVEEIRHKYPWINMADIKLGCLGTEGEGVFNAKELLKGYIEKSLDLGVNYVKAEMVDFEMELQRDVLMEGVKPGTFQKIKNLLYKTDDDEIHSLKFAVCVIAAGTESANVAKYAKIGEAGGLLRIPLPVEKREFNVYSIDNSTNEMAVKMSSPYVMDTSGLWLRRNGLQNNLHCGQIPLMIQDSEYSNSEIFKASLLNRYPHLKNAEVKIISNEILDCNTYDDTGFLGTHSYHTNLVFATGFGRNGIQHSPGIGRAIAEIIIDSQYSSIDFTRFGLDRLLTDEPTVEFNVY